MKEAIMSRSRKKKPYVSITCCGDSAGRMKEWKKQCNSEFRSKVKGSEERHPLTAHKRYIDRCTAPNDGKQYWDDPKAYRK